MRTERTVTVLSMALVLGACGKPQEPTAALSVDLQKDLAAASAAAKDLAPAPQPFTRMRFVSDLEQSRAATPKRVASPSRRHDALAARPVADPMTAMMAHTPVVLASSTSSPAPTVEIAARPAPGVVAVPVGATDEGVIDHAGGGGGIGAMIGGIIGNVVIRGGRAEDGKCDPRTDARANGTLRGRPDFGLPQPTGQVFGRRR